MTVAREAGASALTDLYWRDEILQALFWMRGEGLASESNPTVLARFLATDVATLADQMGRLVDEGYLEVRGTEAYALTHLGLKEGGRSFHDEFAELTRPSHGDCGPSCWCRDPAHIGEPCPNDPKHPPAEPRPDVHPREDSGRAA